MNDSKRPEDYGYRAPVVMTEPLEAEPRFANLRIRWYELTYNDEAAATLRWRVHNATQPQTCACGKPGTVRVGNEDPRLKVMGDAQPFWWRCEDHAWVPLDAGWSNGAPLIGMTRETCSSMNYANATGIVRACSCGTHVGERWDARD